MIKDRLKPKIGRVLNIKTRKPILNVRVYIYKGDRQLEVCKTDASGIISSKLEPGEYEVRVAKEGYKSASDVTFQKINLKVDGYFDNNLFLEQKSVFNKTGTEKNPFA